MSSSACAASYEKPIYYLQFSVARADVEVRLNDIPVLRHTAAGFTESEKPVPESVVNGENILVVRVRPLKGESDLFAGQKSVDVRLVVRERNSPLDQYETLLHVNLDVVEEQSEVLKNSEKDAGSNLPELLTFDEQQIAARRSVNINSPYPEWEWENGMIIENNEENYQTLLDEYKKIYQVLKSENIDQIKKLYTSAALEYATAYHYKDVAEGYRIMNVGSLVGDSEWLLGDINKFLERGFVLRLEVYGNGKLAHLVDRHGVDGGIVYLNKNVKMTSFQKFGFYKNIENKWVLIR